MNIKSKKACTGTCNKLNTAARLSFEMYLQIFIETVVIEGSCGQSIEEILRLDHGTTPNQTF